MKGAMVDLIHALQAQDLADMQTNQAARSHQNDGGIEATIPLNPYRDELHENVPASKDHLLSEATGEAKDPDFIPSSRPQSATPELDRVLKKSFASSTYSDDDSSPGDDDAPHIDGTTSIGECFIDGNPFPLNTLMTAPCGHTYCEDCISYLFELSLTDESFFPPQCCRQTIPIDIARPFLTGEAANTFEAHFVELSTLDRTYCHEKSCGAFIPPTSVQGEKATCPDCDLVTCAVCKSSSHDGGCPEGPNHDEIFMAAARESRYQKCYQGKRMVELSFGCYHVTYA